jgi:hypothetical protein
MRYLMLCGPARISSPKYLLVIYLRLLWENEIRIGKFMCYDGVPLVFGIETLSSPFSAYVRLADDATE